MGRAATPWIRRTVVAGGVVGAGVAVVLALGSTISAERPAPPNPVDAARGFVRAWERGDLRAMYRMLDRRARRHYPFARFTRAYRRAGAVSALRSVHALGRITATDDGGHALMRVRSRIFPAVEGGLDLPLVRSRAAYRVGWRPSLAFPGLAAGEHLARRALPPRRRGAILARDGTVLANGAADARSYPQGPDFALVTGYVKAPQGAAAIAQRERDGWPADTPYGQGGLEASLDATLAGSPAVELLARGAGAPRVLARRPGTRPSNVRTTLDVGMQEAAALALGGRYGGAVLLDARSGAVLADAGLGMDALQPPGSSFKTITAVAALESGRATLASTYPYERFTVLDGWKLRNFHHESCGGTLEQAFAVSCNSVYAPLAADVGPRRLIAAAERFGFDATPTLAYPAPTSVVPAANSLASDLASGVAGIGQGGVSASPLQMASVAATIGTHGMRHAPWLVLRPRSASDRRRPRRVVPRPVAYDVESMMQAVVRYGTGTGAAIAGVTVAGKTGTAEIGPDAKDDAWFIGYAPSPRPRYAVAVLVVNGGVGGEVAAPIARSLLESALAQ